MEIFFIILIVVIVGVWSFFHIIQKLKVSSSGADCKFHRCCTSQIDCQHGEIADCDLPLNKADFPNSLANSEIRKRIQKTMICLCMLIGSLHSFSAWAIDTVEPFEKGASDVEVYFVSNGFSHNTSEIRFGGLFQLGYGLTDRISAAFNGFFSSDTSFQVEDKALKLTVYGILIDTSYFDLDLFLDFRLSGSILSTVEIAPGMELNFDIGHFGIFATVFEVISGNENPQINFDSELAIGVYWIVTGVHQILILYDSIVHYNTEKEQSMYEIGGLGIGYNVIIHDRIELINEIKCDIPQNSEALSFSISTGILVTLL